MIKAIVTERLADALTAVVDIEILTVVGKITLPAGLQVDEVIIALLGAGNAVVDLRATGTVTPP